MTFRHPVLTARIPPPWFRARGTISPAALPAGLSCSRRRPFPAHVPVPAPRPDHGPAAHHLAVRRRGAASLPGPVHPAAARPRAADGAEPRVRAAATEPHCLRLAPPGSAHVLCARQVIRDRRPPKISLRRRFEEGSG